GCPARVADSVIAGSRLFRNQFGERRDPPGALARFELITVNNRDAGRIVAAIFEATEPIEQNRRSLFAPDVTDDSTHIRRRRLPLPGEPRKRARGAKR